MRAVAALLLIALVACGGDDEQASSATGSTSPTSVATSVAVTPTGFERVAATATTADGTVCELCLWLADQPDMRRRGLMGVTDLGDADGMVFRYDDPTSGTFWMKDTLIPLSIAFYDADGGFQDSFDMAPCEADPCLRYPTPNDFTYAIEVPAGELASLGLTPGSVLVVSELPYE